MGFLDRIRKARGADRSAHVSAVRFEIDAAALSDPGPVREQNEDRTLSVALEGEPIGAHLIALADGMGGHQAGEIASELAIETAKTAYLSDPGIDPQKRLMRAMIAANAAVFSASQERPDRQGMGTTLLLLALGAGVAHFSWVGDSRLYHLRGGKLEQLTEDDTLVMRMARDGLLSREEVASHPDRNVLYQALGTHPEIPVQHVGGPVQFASDDRFLLSSDGLHDVVADASIGTILGTGPAHEAAIKLIRTAIEQGTEDNVSVCVVRIVPADSTVRAPRTTAVIPVDQA